jgi:hypothetical protein
VIEEPIAFLRARYDEEERVAKGATWGGTPWRMEGMSIWGRSWRASERSRETLVVRHTWPQEGAHIVRWDPNRVLIELDVKRKRLDWIQSELADDASNETARWLLRLEAEPYAIHPDYREEWKP